MMVGCGLRCFKGERCRRFCFFFVDRRCKLWRRLFQKVGSGSGSLNCILFSGAEPVHLFLSPRLFLKRAGLIL